MVVLTTESTIALFLLKHARKRNNKYTHTQTKTHRSGGLLHTQTHTDKKPFAIHVFSN